MPICSMKIDFVVGITLEDACIKAIKISKILDCNIEFDFNDIGISVRPTTDIGFILNEYKKIREKIKNSENCFIMG